MARSRAVRQRAHLTALIERIDLTPETVDIRILRSRLPALLCDGNHHGDGIRAGADNAPPLILSIQAHLQRTGRETRFLIEGAGRATRGNPDHSLHRVIAQAHRYRTMVMRNGGKTMTELADEAGVGGSYLSRILRLGFLAPDIVTAILRDRHPIALTAKRLASEIRLPIAWEDQRSLLGMPRSPDGPDQTLSP